MSLFGSWRDTIRLLTARTFIHILTPACPARPAPPASPAPPAPPTHPVPAAPPAPAAPLASAAPAALAAPPTCPAPAAPPVPAAPTAVVISYLNFLDRIISSCAISDRNFDLMLNVYTLLSHVQCSKVYFLTN